MGVAPSSLVSQPVFALDLLLVGWLKPDFHPKSSLLRRAVLSVRSVRVLGVTCCCDNFPGVRCLVAHKGSSDAELVEQRKEELLICGKYFINVFASLLDLFYSGLNLKDNGGKKAFISSLPVKQTASL